MKYPLAEASVRATQSGQIVKTPPSTAGQYVTPIGEALATNELIIRIKRPIKLG